MAKQALGRGLGALMGGNSPTVKPASPAAAQALASSESISGGTGGIQKLPVARIKPCSFQPRKQFDESALQELADSIKEQGLLQPLIVRKHGEDYELIAGERRWRAAQSAGLSEVPVIIREADDLKVLEIALIENLQRENLNPMEEAQGYGQLIEQFHLTQEEAATRVGKSRGTVANLLRLLHLPSDVQSHIRFNRLSTGHAKALVGLSSSTVQKQLADQIIQEGLSVRATEELIASRASVTSPLKSSPVKNLPPLPDVHVTAVLDRLRERFATKVAFKYRKGKGSIEVLFFSDEELQDILYKMQVTVD